MMREIPEAELAALPDPLPEDWKILDVRELDEWEAGHIEGAVHIPLMEVPQRVADIATGQQVLVVCKVGARSAQATGFLQAQGVDVVNLAGGMYAWAASGRPMVAPGDAAPFVA